MPGSSPGTPRPRRCTSGPSALPPRLLVVPAYGRVVTPDEPTADAFRFDDELRARLVANLASHERTALHVEGHRRAAVAVVVVDSDHEVHGTDPHPATPDRMSGIPGAGSYPLTGSVAGTAGGPAILLTRRSARLRAHSGQWALPGGRVDGDELYV